MALFELKVEVAPEATDGLEELIGEWEALELLVLEDRPAGRAWLAGYFETRDLAETAWQRLAAAVRPAWRLGEPMVRAMPDEDWKNSYKAHFKASKFGRLNWVPVWERETFVVPVGEEVLWLDPGMAFGTGNHETTRLCCERLAAHAARSGSAGRVLDAGCGSGILALSAVKLGFAQVAGFDNDPEAIRVSCENGELNGLAGRAEFFVGDLRSGLSGRQAELVMANIQSDVLVRCAAELCAAVAPGGELVLSGILSCELEGVRRVFAGPAGAWRVATRELGEWADLCLIR